MSHSGMLAVLSHASSDEFAYKIAAGLGVTDPIIMRGTLIDAAESLSASKKTPKYILVDIDNRRESALHELDALAQQCLSGTFVVAVGQINDIQFYRMLTDAGVPDYFPLPASIDDVLKAFTRQKNLKLAPVNTIDSTSGRAEIISFMSAAGGDGASTAALNVAYSLALQSGKPTILVDLDYQYGMTARNLNLTSQYGIKDLFEHPDRGIDSMLIQRMVSHYGPLHVISAPTDLRFLPDIKPEAIAELMRALQQSYSYIILDLPHVWKPWIAEACRQTTTFVLIAQLWLKSVSHAARILRACRDEKALPKNVKIVINRSGAKFKEAIDSRDFERVAGLPVSHTLANDIKTVVEAENQAKTIIELPHDSLLRYDIENLVRLIKGEPLLEPKIEKNSLSSFLPLLKSKF